VICGCKSGKGEEMICPKCGEEIKIPCHKLDGRVLCYPCSRKEQCKVVENDS